ncbi:ParB/RepB/Spo0J family partition protein [bacterium]|nr:ParB/RepB/Spo0J family partition protein [bacterium]
MLDSNTKRLGKGLEALIPKGALASGRTIVHIPLNKVSPNPFQPRKHFKNEAIESLSESIKKFGLAQPILVRRKGIGYEIVSGERRFRASRLANLERIPAIVKDYTDQESLMMAIVENIEREELNAIEVAKGYNRLVNEFSLTHEEIAKIFSRSRSAVTNSLRLLSLPEKIIMAITDGDFSEGHARALLSISHEPTLNAIFELAIKNRWTVRDIEAYIKGLREKSDVQKEKNISDKQYLGRFESALSDEFDTRVKITGNKKKGYVKLYYKSNKGFSDLLKKLGRV